MTIVYAIIIFCLLIFVHEFGHLIAAKSVGIRVNAFALGMGPRLFKFTKGETEYSLRLFPIGGFCAMEGEDEESADPRAFGNRPFLPKALVIVAGSFMNLLLAVLVVSAVVFSLGTPGTTVRDVETGSPAAAAGFLPGDRILSVDGREMEGWEDLRGAVQGAPREGAILVAVLRDGAEITLRSEVYTDQEGVRKIGVTPKMERKIENLLPSLGIGARNVGDMALKMLEAIGQIFTGALSIKELTGPVGIVHFVGDSARNGLLDLAWLTALISLNLGIVNMLPIPALDGGRLLFLVIRKFTGKALTDEMEGRIHFVGILLLFGLMIFVTVQDITRFIL